MRAWYRVPLRFPCCLRGARNRRRPFNSRSVGRLFPSQVLLLRITPQQGLKQRHLSRFRSQLRPSRPARSRQQSTFAARPLHLAAVNQWPTWNGGVVTSRPGVHLPQRTQSSRVVSAMEQRKVTAGTIRFTSESHCAGQAIRPRSTQAIWSSLFQRHSHSVGPPWWYRLVVHCVASFDCNEHRRAT